MDAEDPMERAYDVLGTILGEHPPKGLVPRAVRAVEILADTRLDLNLEQQKRKRLEVQLAGILVAAEGGANGTNDAHPGDYGHSAAFEAVRALRGEVERLRSQLERVVLAAKRAAGLPESAAVIDGDAFVRNVLHSLSHDPDQSELTRLRGRVSELETVLHAKEACPGWLYATTTGPRKRWLSGFEPPGDGWEPNDALADGGWERFEYHEERYWRRPVPRADAAEGNDDERD